MVNNLVVMNKKIFLFVSMITIVLVSMTVLSQSVITQQEDIPFGHFGHEVYIELQNGYVSIQDMLDNRMVQTTANNVHVVVEGESMTLHDFLNRPQSDSIFFADEILEVNGTISRNYWSWSTALCPEGYKVLFGRYRFDPVVADPPAGCGRNSFHDITFLGQYPVLVEEDGVLLEGWRVGTVGRCNQAIAHCAPR